MIVLRGHPFEWELPGPSAVTVGVFDGVHLGHRRVLGHLVASAGKAGLLAAAVTFDPHPLRLLAPVRAPLMLTSVDQRIEQFLGLGVDVAGVLSFPDIRELPPGGFASEVLAGVLQARRVVVGADFHFGRDRTGDAGLLVQLGETLGFEVIVVDMLGHPEGVVSSTRIRALLAEARVEEAATLLARPYELRGVVEEGDGRGRTIGIPTANIVANPDRVIPGNGVFACRSQWHGGERPAVVNIGTRPTFSGEGRRVEAHLLDFDGDLYGVEMAVSFVARIRDEMRFASVDQLRLQIEEDIAKARAILGEDIRAG